MRKDEKGFQNYFMRLAKVKNFHRTSLTNSSGYPDLTAFHGDRHSLIELKDLILGITGDKKLRQCFEKTQPPWYMSYLKNGGTRLFVAFRIQNSSKNWYGLWKLTPEVVMKLSRNELTYKTMTNYMTYKSFDTCMQLIEEIEK